MAFYSVSGMKGIFTTRRCVFGISAVITGAVGWAAAEAVSGRRRAALLPDLNEAINMEETWRQACSALRGYDAVVRSYYLPTGTKEAAGCKAEADHSSVRLVVGDSYAPPSSSSRGPQTPTVPPATTALSSASWPAGSQKYAALLLEPQEVAAVGKNPLRWLADRGTHQTVVRCDPLAERGPCQADPSFLGATYLRVMISAFLLLTSSTESQLHVGILGVGGGSLPNFLQHFWDRRIASMDLVEVEAGCLQAAVEQLGMRCGPKARLHVADGQSFLRERAREMELSQIPTGYDLLFVDMFAGSEMPSYVESSSFVRLCFDSLRRGGVAAYNLPERSSNFEEACRMVFGGANVIAIPAPSTSNVVVLTRRPVMLTVEEKESRSPVLSHRQLYWRAKELSERLQLPFDLSSDFPRWWRHW